MVGVAGLGELFERLGVKLELEIDAIGFLAEPLEGRANLYTKME